MKEIKAREGYYLAQNADVTDRIFVTIVKGVRVNESDWREATEQEKEEYEKQMNDGKEQ
jgi:hypothetical protein